VVVCGLGCQVDSGREHLFFLVAATVLSGEASVFVVGVLWLILVCLMTVLC
jgi:biotin transporter BioY